MVEQSRLKREMSNFRFSWNLRMGKQPFDFFSTASETCTVKVHIRDEPNMVRSVVANWHRLNQISCGQSLFSSMTLKNSIRIRMRVRVAQHMWKIMAAEFSHWYNIRNIHSFRAYRWMGVAPPDLRRSSILAGPNPVHEPETIIPLNFKKNAVVYPEFRRI